MREDDVEIIGKGTSVKARGEGGARETLVNERRCVGVSGISVGAGGGGEQHRKGTAPRSRHPGAWSGKCRCHADASAAAGEGDGDGQHDGTLQGGVGCVIEMGHTTLNFTDEPSSEWPAPVSSPVVVMENRLWKVRLCDLTLPVSVDDYG